jgi:hypothetical protein
MLAPWHATYIKTLVFNKLVRFRLSSLVNS